MQFTMRLLRLIYLKKTGNPIICTLFFFFSKVRLCFCVRKTCSNKFQFVLLNTKSSVSLYSGSLNHNIYCHNGLLTIRQFFTISDIMDLFLWLKCFDDSSKGHTRYTTLINGNGKMLIGIVTHKNVIKISKYLLMSKMC